MTTAFGSITREPLCLYHGGKIVGPVEVKTQAKQMAYGPGLYLTTSYWTAREYRGGNGFVYRVCLDAGLRWAHDVRVSLQRASDFVRAIPKLKRRDAVLADLERVAARRPDGTVSFVVVLNLLDTHTSYGAKVAQDVAKLLVVYGVNASLVTGANSGNEDWVVLHNSAVVRSVEKLMGPESDMQRIVES